MIPLAQESLSFASPVLVFPPVVRLDPAWTREIYRRSAAFRAAFDICDAACLRHLGWSLEQRFEARETETSWGLEEGSLPMLTALQISLWRVLDAQGVLAAAIVGQCGGELAALHAAGALSVDQAFRVCATTDGFMRENLSRGRVGYFLVGVPFQLAAQAAQNMPGVEAVADRGPGQSIVAIEPGTDPQAFAAALPGDRITALKRVAAGFPWHTRGAGGFLEYASERLADVRSRPPSRPYYSTALGKRLTGPPDVGHWWAMGRHPVLRRAIAATVLEDGYREFVELGPTDQAVATIRTVAEERGIAVRTATTGGATKTRGLMRSALHRLLKVAPEQPELPP